MYWSPIVTSDKELLAFIDAAHRMPPGAKKEIWVSWLVKQYECRIQGGKFTLRINTTDDKEKQNQQTTKAQSMDIRS